MSPIWGDAPSNPTATNFCMWGPSLDVINYATFHLYPRSSFCGAWPRIFSSPIDLKCDLYNSWSSTELRCDCEWVPNVWLSVLAEFVAGECVWPVELVFCRTGWVPLLWFEALWCRYKLPVVLCYELSIVCNFDVTSECDYICNCNENIDWTIILNVYLIAIALDANIEYAEYLILCDYISIVRKLAQIVSVFVVILYLLHCTYM